MGQTVRNLTSAPSLIEMGEEFDDTADDVRAQVADQKSLLRDQVNVLNRQVAVLEAQVRVLENTVAHMRDIWHVVGRLLDRHIEPG